ncbi:uncharacterized protein LOC115750527 isoform X2 [Rhodamnia argentea]|uniref:Uncharacterized protein LOC115750527 isoform X2 n=1 Tax=Rhodamnia argentea TaxID=178133 RepID=A0A8B8QBA1_9MYRT|nr:uncharacterized protein LOC115750527 isoform X2 [Rhodamnia argentea]
MQVPRWRNLLVIKNSLMASTSATVRSAAFHSTPATCEKWKYKWNSDFSRGGQQPSKNYIRYTTRQKRAETKKALKDLVLGSGSSRFSFHEKGPAWDFDETENQSDQCGNRGRSKSSSQRAGKSHQKKMKRKFRRESFSEDLDDYPETVFQATFGNRWYTWSCNSRHSFTSENASSGFQWKENFKWGNRRTREWETASETELDDESIRIGSVSDRKMLGLPTTGPLKIEDVKNAFRLSALKWHPDKHQGPSQSMAEEKFKLCVNAYKSLCSALSAA